MGVCVKVQRQEHELAGDRGEAGWVQGQLFPLEVARRHRRGCGGQGSVHRLDRSRVTRDEAVAASYEQTHVAQHEVKLGLAAALARLSPEKRQALRAVLWAPRVA